MNEYERLAEVLLPHDRPITMRHLSSILKKQGFRIGTPRLWRWMEENGLVIPGTQEPTSLCKKRCMLMRETRIVHEGNKEPTEKTVTKLTRDGAWQVIKMLLYPLA